MRVIFPLLFPKPRTDFTGYFGQHYIYTHTHTHTHFADVSYDKIKGPNPANKRMIMLIVMIKIDCPPAWGGGGKN